MKAAKSTGRSPITTPQGLGGVVIANFRGWFFRVNFLLSQAALKPHQFFGAVPVFHAILSPLVAGGF